MGSRHCKTLENFEITASRHRQLAFAHLDKDASFAIESFACVFPIILFLISRSSCSMWKMIYALALCLFVRLFARLKAPCWPTTITSMMSLFSRGASPPPPATGPPPQNVPSMTSMTSQIAPSSNNNNNNNTEPASHVIHSPLPSRPSPVQPASTIDELLHFHSNSPHPSDAHTPPLPRLSLPCKHSHKSPRIETTTTVWIYWPC